MPIAYTSTAAVAAAIGPAGGPIFAADGYAAAVVDAANAWTERKRAQAGYDDAATEPGPDVSMGATLYAIALWRERAATDGYPSFEDLSSFSPVGGSLGQIRRLLGIGRAAVDAPTDAEAAAYRRRRSVRIR